MSKRWHFWALKKLKERKQKEEDEKIELLNAIIVKLGSTLKQMRLSGSVVWYGRSKGLSKFPTLEIKPKGILRFFREAVITIWYYNEVSVWNSNYSGKGSSISKIIGAKEIHNEYYSNKKSELNNRGNV